MLAPVGAIEGVPKTLNAWPGQMPGWLLDHGLAESKLRLPRDRLTVPA